MFRSTEELIGYRVRALDGELGKVKDFYFDDRQWGIRYLIVDTGGWIRGRKVLISPVEIDQPDWVEQVLPVQLTRQQIENSPDIDEKMPVERQKEIELAGYYGWPFYWGTGELPTGAMSLVGAANAPDAPHPVEGDPHLHSIREVTGYHLAGPDGQIGRVQDLIADTKEWNVHFLVADLRPKLPDRKVLISPRSVDRIDWENHAVRVSLTEEQLRNRPEYDPNAPVNWQVEIHHYDYYGRPFIND